MRVLMISATFPPATDTRALQGERVANAIAASGCEVQVIAGIDRANTADLEEHSNDKRSYAVHYVPYRDHRSGLCARILNRLDGDIASTLSFLPWNHSATRLALRVIQSFSPDVILSVSNPFNSHVVGLALYHETGIPWAASFSDPWPRRLLPAPYGKYASPLLPPWQISSLRMVLKRTYAVHVSSPYAIPVFDRILPLPLGAKTWVIPHVANWSEPISDGSSVLPRGHWLVHIGTITPERVSAEVLEGIRVACRSMPGRFDGLLCIGNVTSGFTQLVRQLDMAKHVIVTSSVTSDAALAAVSGASALLLIEAHMAGSPFLPSKFVDYACSGKPIVAVTPSKSQTRDYIQMYGGGYAASQNPLEIAAAIEQIFADLTASTARSCSAARTYRALFSPATIGCEYRRLLAARPT